MAQPSTHKGRRLMSFRLCDLPPALLERGREVAVKTETSFIERIAIGAAAEHPSARIYWVSEKAYLRVMGTKRWSGAV